MGKTVADLRAELRKRKLPTDGLKADLEARLDAADQQVVEEAMNETKRCKTVMKSIADEFLCPITQELPVDPVTAEDGKIYERTAIETWLQEKESSPSTGASMGTRLFPAVQVRSMIEHLVKSGAVDAEKAAAWTKKLEDETQLKELKSKAESGDVEAMFELSRVYKFGDLGLATDMKQSRAWSQKGAELGDVKAMVRYGFYLWTGTGGDQNDPLGVYFMIKAAMLGATTAASNLALCFKEGSYGLPRDVKQAKFWFTQIAEGKCAVLHTSPHTLQQTIDAAKNELQDLD